MFRHKVKKHPNKNLQVDTPNILFICGGAFAGLEKLLKIEAKEHQLDFGAKVKSMRRLQFQKL